ncbi:MAG: diguanylate cyclase, partial [Pseudomonadota bacterium]
MKFADVKRDRIRPLPRHELGRDIIDFFKQHPESVGCAIADDENRPIGYIDRHEFMTKVSALYGRALYDTRAADSLSNQNYRLLDESADLSSLIGHGGLTDEIDRCTGLIIVDEQGRYAGITNAMHLTQTLLDANNHLIQELQQEVDDRKSAEERARRLAHSDSLTGLYNRRHFMNLVNEQVKDEVPSYLFYIDLDRFKVINDVRGHAVGDFVLKTVAVRLIELGEGFTAARIGGDEFAVIADMAQMDRSLDQIIADMSASLTEPIMTPVGILEVGASIGTAVFPDDEADGHKLIDAADRAMLAAKADGGGSCVYSECTTLSQGSTGRINERLQQAVHKQKIVPAYQPIISLETGEIIGHEVLARWPASDGG